MASRRPSSRPSSRRRSSGSEAARTTREINAEKSRQRRAAAKAAQSSKGAEASAKRQKSAKGTRGEQGAKRSFFRRNKGVEKGSSRSFVRPSADGSSVLSIGGLDVSTRLLVVLIVAAILSVMLVPSLYQWWQQERELAQIKTQVAQQQQQNADMQRQLDLWNDPDYISTQARERLGFVRPGETQYTVVDPGPQYQDSALAAAAASTGPARPWVQQLGILVGKADQPPSATPVPSAETSQSGQAPTTSQESGE
ncbi:FtsB family cell division protein [Sanguibacter keddieii]|uniref:FtsB family cell division protein n=1 Tax=Sanguibacter keddieii TaxID=60920 RepID=UPI0006612059|nr:septum formation initiator family protein [Sanguibacter keddieii]